MPQGPDPKAPQHAVATATIPIVPDTVLVDQYLDKLEARIDKIGDKLRESLTPAVALEELARAVDKIMARLRPEPVPIAVAQASSDPAPADGGRARPMESQPLPTIPEPRDRGGHDEPEFFTLSRPGADAAQVPASPPQAPAVDLSPVVDVLTQIKDDVTILTAMVSEIRTAARLQ